MIFENIILLKKCLCVLLINCHKKRNPFSQNPVATPVGSVELWEGHMYTPSWSVTLFYGANMLKAAFPSAQ